MMRTITVMTIISFIFTAITSQWMKAYNEITQMINPRNVAPDAVPQLAQNILKNSYSVILGYTNKTILLFSLILLVTTLITRGFQIRDDIN